MRCFAPHAHRNILIGPRGAARSTASTPSPTASCPRATSCSGSTGWRSSCLPRGRLQPLARRTRLPSSTSRGRCARRPALRRHRPLVAPLKDTRTRSVARAASSRSCTWRSPFRRRRREGGDDWLPASTTCDATSSEPPASPIAAARGGRARGLEAAEERRYSLLAAGCRHGAPDVTAVALRRRRWRPSSTSSGSPTRESSANGDEPTPGSDLPHANAALTEQARSSSTQREDAATRHSSRSARCPRRPPFRRTRGAPVGAARGARLPSTR